MSSRSSAASRLSGWWGWSQIAGTEDRSRPVAPRRDPAPIGSRAAEPKLVRPAADVDPALRLHCLQAIWGAAETRPGGKAAHVATAKAAGLKEGGLVVEIGCGLGGFAQAMARTFGARVTAADLDPLNRRVASELLAGKRCASAIDVRPCTLQPFGLDASNADLVVVRDTLGRTTDQTEFVAGIAAVAAPGATIVFNEFFMRGAGGAPSLPPDIRPADLNAFRAALKGAGLEVVADVNAGRALTNAALVGLSALNDRLADAEPPAELMQVIQQEAADWAKLTAAIAGDAVQFRTIFARKPAPAQPAPRKGLLPRASAVKALILDGRRRFGRRRT